MHDKKEVMSPQVFGKSGSSRDLFSELDLRHSPARDRFQDAHTGRRKVWGLRTTFV